MTIACAVALALACLLCPSALAYRFNEPTVTQTGPEQVVFDWGDDQTGNPTGVRPRCADDDIPDTAAHAYRDDQGRVVLLSSHFTNRRFIGPDFDTLSHPCAVVMSSTGSTNPADFDDHEWITSPYTLDGHTVYALVHEEYQGWRDGYGNSCFGDWVQQQKCWRNSITLATSTNGGASFTSPGALVASSPYRFSSGIGPYGYFKPTNIVYAADGYYYAAVRSLTSASTPAQPDGTCIMRTNDLASRTSWRGWDGTGFNVSFIDPYTESGNPADHVCATVDRDLYRMSSSLVYSEYLGRYVLLDLLPGDGPYNPNPADKVPGVYYSTSADLIHWNPPKLLMEAKFTGTFVCGDPDPVRVPSLIDHASTSRNFDTIGQRPYLYFTRPNMIYNADGSCYLGLDRDLVRIPVEFRKPAAPTVTATTPAAAANNNAPTVRGTAPNATTVKLFTNQNCSGTPAGTGSATAFATGIRVTVPDDSTTSFYATATDSSDVASDCSTSSVSYVEDSTPPVAPTVSVVDPTSPANDNHPKVVGSADAGSVVKLFANAVCNGQPLGSSGADGFAAAGVPATVPDNSTTVFHATATDQAGNTSGCSTSSVSYTEDSTPPAAPALTGTNPASPADANAPMIHGTAAAGSTVRLFTSTSCTGAPAAIGTAAAFAAPGLAVDVPDDTVTSFYATATDQAGNVSACSPAPITYVESTHGDVPPSEDPPATQPPSSSSSSPSSPLAPVSLAGAPTLPDRLAPHMTVGAKVVKVGKRGNVRLRLTCPGSEPRGCTGTVRLKVLSGSTKLGGRAFKVAGGATASVGWRLTKRGRQLVKRATELWTVATIQARDEAGNSRTDKVNLVLQAPGRKRNS